MSEAVVVDVADGDDVAEVAGLVDVAGALAADADAGDVQPLVGLLDLQFLGPGHPAGHPEPDAGQGRVLEEVTAIGAKSHMDCP